MMVSLQQFHERHERLWWILLETLAVVAVLVFATSLSGLCVVGFFRAATHQHRAGGLLQQRSADATDFPMSASGMGVTPDDHQLAIQFLRHVNDQGDRIAFADVGTQSIVGDITGERTQFLLKGFQRG